LRTSVRLVQRLAVSLLTALLLARANAEEAKPDAAPSSAALPSAAPVTPRVQSVEQVKAVLTPQQQQELGLGSNATDGNSGERRQREAPQGAR
jgi:hypothetical protein